MANKQGLRVIGFAYGALTLAVALIAVVVVSAQIDNSVQAQTEPTPIVTAIR